MLYYLHIIKSKLLLLLLVLYTVPVNNNKSPEIIGNKKYYCSNYNVSDNMLIGITQFIQYKTTENEIIILSECI